MFGAVALMALLLIVFLGLEPWMGILGGFILGGTSSAVVIPMITSLNASEESTTLLTVESALTDVLCIIGTVRKAFKPFICKHRSAARKRSIAKTLCPYTAKHTCC